jgi:hypothetical protein
MGKCLHVDRQATLNMSTHTQQQSSGFAGSAMTVLVLIRCDHVRYNTRYVDSLSLLNGPQVGSQGWVLDHFRHAPAATSHVHSSDIYSKG